MPLHLFRSKRPSASKSNTIKKSEPKIDHPPLQRDPQPTNEGHILDITTVGAWAKENAADDSTHDGGAVLRRKTPDRATLINELDAAHPSIISQKATREECHAEVAHEDGIFDEPDEESQPQQMLNLLLGRQDASSPYFTRRHIIIPLSAVPNSVRDSTPATSNQHESTLTLPDLDPHAFELYQIWLHSGTISSRCQLSHSSNPETGHEHKWQVCWPLFNAHILGYKIDAPNFADQVMDLLEDRLRNGNGLDLDTIELLFTREGVVIPQVLKDFVADKYLKFEMTDLSDQSISALPPSFLQFALQRALLRLSTTTPTSSVSSCRYHLHSTPEQCYRENIPLYELERQQRLDLDRQRSVTDAGEVMRNTRDNNIKTVDWEERRAKALRATTVQATLVDGMSGLAQIDGADDELEKSTASRDARSSTLLTEKPVKPTRLLNPSLIQDERDHPSIASASPSAIEQEREMEPKAARSPILPGAFPLSRNGSKSSIESYHH